MPDTVLSPLSTFSFSLYKKPLKCLTLCAILTRDY